MTSSKGGNGVSNRGPIAKNRIIRHFHCSDSDQRSCVFNGIGNKVGDMFMGSFRDIYLHDIPICSLQPVYLGPHFFSPILNPGQLVHPVEWLGDYLRLHPDWPVWPCQSRHNLGLVQEGLLGKAFCAFFLAKVLRILGQLPSGKRLHS